MYESSSIFWVQLRSPALVFILNTRICGALTGPKILAGTAPIKAGSARLVLVDLVAMFRVVQVSIC